jgi:hypothetical protein
MGLIFEDGEKLFGAKHDKDDRGFSIYGDGYKLTLDSIREILPTHHPVYPHRALHSCKLSISDYDEHNNLEYETTVRFSKKEVDMLISVLKDIRSNL